jgi:formaldehyde-activating enzyme involved in methanogenesis
MVVIITAMSVNIGADNSKKIYELITNQAKEQ